MREFIASERGGNLDDFDIVTSGARDESLLDDYAAAGLTWLNEEFHPDAGWYEAALGRAAEGLMRNL